LKSNWDKNGPTWILFPGLPDSFFFLQCFSLFSPPVRWGLLDFTSAGPPPPPRQLQALVISQTGACWSFQQRLLELRITCRTSTTKNLRRYPR
jgi:hypothetical protein